MSNPPPPPPPPMAKKGGGGPPPPPPPKITKKKPDDPKKTSKKHKTVQIVTDPQGRPKRSVMMIPRKNETGIAGLTNQGATCYLNSLLQALYMTPEFRHWLFTYRYDPKVDGPKERCIPLQLQILFAKLKYSDYGSLETRDLTYAFGWTDADSFQQQDVQELARVLFDALERTHEKHASKVDDASDSSNSESTTSSTSTETNSGASETPKEDKEDKEGVDTDQTESKEDKDNKDNKDEEPLAPFEPYLSQKTDGPGVTEAITELFRGDIVDYIDCQTCHNPRERTEPYYDLGVQIQGLVRLENSLTAYMQSELMSGDNQVECSFCGCKRDAQKGQKIGTVPRLIMFQLQRFAFSYETFTRVKVHDEFGFPLQLDMSPYIGSDEASLYELYGVLIHTGTSGSGHYFAYIQSFEDGKWYSFNDENIMHLSTAAIPELFGNEAPESDAGPSEGEGEEENGKTGEEKEKEKQTQTQQSNTTATGADFGWYAGKSVIKSNTGDEGVSDGLPPVTKNAYMLLYRKVGSGQMEMEELMEHGENMIPEDLWREIQKENKDFEEKKSEFDRKKNLFKLNIMVGEEIKKVEVSQNATYAEALVQVLKALDMDIPTSRARLRNYNKSKKEAAEVFSTRQDVTLVNLGWYSHKQLLLETIDEGEVFPEADSEVKFQLGLIKFNPENTSVRTAKLHTDMNVTQTDTFVDRQIGTEGADESSETSSSSGEASSAVDESTEQKPAEEAQEQAVFEEPIIIKVAQFSTYGELKEQVQTLMGVDADKQLICRMNQDMGIGVTQLPPAIEDSELLVNVGVLNNDTIYIEFHEEGSLGDSELIKWFEEEAFLIDIQFNMPVADSKKDQVLFDQTVLFDKRKTLRQLKEEGIGPVIGLGPDEFKLRRHLLSMEYKEDDLNLTECGIYEGTAVFVEVGTPLKQGEFQLKVCLYQPTEQDHEAKQLAEEVDRQNAFYAGEEVSNSSAGNDDKESSSEGQVTEDGEIIHREFSTTLCEIVVHETELVADMKKRLQSQLQEVIASEEYQAKLEANSGGPALFLKQVPSDLSLIRFREKVQNSAGRILLDGQTIKEGIPQLHDAHKCCVQILSEPETKENADQAVIFVQQWFPSDWKLDVNRSTLTVNKSVSISEVQELLAVYLEGRIPVDKINVARKPLSKGEGMLAMSMGNLSWIQNEERRFFLNDGDTVLYADARDVVKVPQFVIDARPKETGIHISTVDEEQAMLEAVLRASAEEAGVEYEG